MKKTIFFILALNATISFGQLKECDCKDALNKDLKQKVTENEYRSFKDWLYEYFQKNEESRTLAKNNDKAKWSGKFMAIIDGLPIKTSGDADWQSSSENQAYYRAEHEYLKNSYITDDAFNELFIEKFDENNLKAYLGCLDLCKNVMAKEGVFGIIGGDKRNEFYIQVQFSSSTGALKITLDGDARYTNMEPIKGLLFKDNLVIHNGQSQTQYFKRLDPTKSASFSFNVKENVVITPLVLDAKPAINQQAIPIGTIVASVLPYESFLKANELENIDNANMEKALWIPCDGRTLTVSKYAQYSGGKIPDLRGVFLRGINDYNVKFPTVVAVSSNQKNPENQMAGQFQNDTFQLHNHKFLSPVAGPLVVFGSPDAGTHANFAEKETSTTGDSETRPKNVTVYYYIKIN